VQPIETKFINAAIKNQVDLERFSEHVLGKVVKVLGQAQDEILKALIVGDPTIRPETEWRRKRLERLNARIGEILEEHYAKIGELHEKDLIDLAGYTKDKTAADARRIFGVNLFDVTLTEANLKAIVTETMIEGQVIGKWWESKPLDYRQRIERSINQGMQKIELGLVQGESVGELVRAIRGYKDKMGIIHPGVMDVTRREAAALVRTSIHQVAQTVRMRIYEANKDVIKGLQVVATLDTRTTPLCRALDGRIFDLERQPLDDDGPPLPPGPPFHWQCRSTLVPIIKSYAELAGGDLSEEKRAALEAMDPGTRASMNGQVSDKITYEEWLKTQSERIQKEVLGETRWDLWRKGKITMADMVHQNGRPLTLEELRKKIGSE